MMRWRLAVARRIYVAIFTSHRGDNALFRASMGDASVRSYRNSSALQNE
jgi:hypothetical protein